MENEEPNEERELWRGKQWRLTTQAIEQIERPHYTIALHRLNDTNWPEHMAEKTWVNLGEFIQVYLMACVMTGTKIETIVQDIRRARLEYQQRLDCKEATFTQLPTTREELMKLFKAEDPFGM